MRDVPLTRRALAQGAVGLLLAACSGPRRSNRAQAASATPTPTASPSVSPPPSVPTRALAVEHGPRNRPEVAITFHAEGDRASTHQLLSVLAENRVPATMFVVGRWLAASPDLAKAITAGGHELGNHTWTGGNTLRMGRAELRGEIERCRDLLIRLTGGPGIAFRPSQMQHATGLVLEEAARAGYQHVVTEDVDPGDSQAVSSATIVAHLTRWTIAGSIISLQTSNLQTIAAVPDILSGLARAGLRPVTVGRLLRP